MRAHHHNTKGLSRGRLNRAPRACASPLEGPARAAPLEPAPSLSLPARLSVCRRAPACAVARLSKPRPALTLAAGWPRSLAQRSVPSQRSVRGPGCPRFLSFPGGAHTSVGRRVSHPPPHFLSSILSGCGYGDVLLLPQPLPFLHPPNYESAILVTFGTDPQPCPGLASAASSPRQGGGPGAGPRLPNSHEGAQLVTALMSGALHPRAVSRDER